MSTDQQACDALRALVREPVELSDAGLDSVIAAVRQAPQRRGWRPPMPTWRFRSMFSATKFVLACAIVTLFGGFLLAGVLTQPSEQQMPAVGVSASATAETEQAEPTTPTAVRAGAFSSVESLAGAPVGTATRLQDGRVLLVDGVRAETWDPATGAVGPAGRTGTPRDQDFHSAVLLADGRALIVGGDMQYGDVQAEVWDPETGSFSAAGAFSEWHSNERPNLTLLTDGRVLVMGGGTHHSDASQVVEVWAPESATFRVAGEMSVARTEQTATLLQDGRVLVVGGETTGPGARETGLSPLASAELWDPVTESFSPAGSLGEGRALHSATLLQDGRVLILGGGDTYGHVTSSAEIWDPATEAFGPAGSLNEARHSHSATLLPDGRVLVTGGWGDSGEAASAEIWDPATESSSLAGSLVHPRGWHSASLLQDGRVLVTGGGSGAEIWEPATDDGTTTAPDLLPGVDLVTEEVAPGVYRVVSDGVRELSREIGAHEWFESGGPRYALDALRSEISVAPDGSVWYFGPDAFYRFGDASQASAGRPGATTTGSVSWAPDGTAWAHDQGRLVQFADGSWSPIEVQPPGGWTGAVVAAPVGPVWALGPGQRVRRLSADGWTEFVAPARFDINESGSGEEDEALKPGANGDVWLIVNHDGGNSALVQFDGSTWTLHEPPGIPSDVWPTLIDTAADGALWVYMRGAQPGTSYLGRYENREWTVLGPEDGVPVAAGFLSGMGGDGLIEAGPAGEVWLTVDVPEGRVECDGVALYDGQAWTRFLAGECVYGLDTAQDGTLWLLAGGDSTEGGTPGHMYTYIITTEAVAATE